MALVSGGAEGGALSKGISALLKDPTDPAPLPPGEDTVLAPDPRLPAS